MRVGIVGLGYVGLPLAVAFCEAGCEVIGVDVDSRMVEALGRGESHVEDVKPEALAAISAASKRAPATRTSPRSTR